MAELKEYWERFDKEFREKCLLFLKELQNKKPKGTTLVLHTDPHDESEKSDYLLYSRYVRPRYEKNHISLRKFIYDPTLPHEMLVETLDSAQSEMNEYGIEIDWKKIMNNSKS